MVEFRQADLFDGIDSDGTPYFTQDHPKIDDADEREKLLAFLRSGQLVLRVNGRAPDFFDRGKGNTVPIATYTDGTWIWVAAVSYYLGAYRLAPAEDFHRHIQSRKYRVGEVDDSTVQAAYTYLMGDD